MWHREGSFLGARGHFRSSLSPGGGKRVSRGGAFPRSYPQFLAAWIAFFREGGVFWELEATLSPAGWVFFIPPAGGKIFHEEGRFFGTTLNFWQRGFPFSARGRFWELEATLSLRSSGFREGSRNRKIPHFDLVRTCNFANIDFFLTW